MELSHPDVLIDLGSVAKGYIADRMAQYMKSKGVLSGLIDARGDIVVFGKRDSIIEIAHPRKPDESITKINIKNHGVATSGDYNQYDKSFDKSHIINQKNYISVTVIAPTLMQADLYATALFVLHESEVEKFAHQNKKIKALCIDKMMRSKKFNGFEEII